MSTPTSYRELLNSKHGSVLVLLKCHMAKAALTDSKPDWESYAERTLDWWTGVMSQLSGVIDNEETVARMVIDKLIQRQSPWTPLLKKELGIA